MLQGGQKFPPELCKSTGSRYDSQQPKGNSPWLRFPWGAVTSQMGSAKCVLGHVLPVHLLPWPPTGVQHPSLNVWGPIFSRMGADSKEQGHCPSLHWEASTLVVPLGSTTANKSNVLSSSQWPTPSSHLTISPILPIYHSGLILFFLIICMTAASEHCTLRAKMYSWNNEKVSARSQVSSVLPLPCSLSRQAASKGQWKEIKKKKKKQS